MEDLIDGTNHPLVRLIVQAENNQIIADNPDYMSWQIKDQALISWLLSSVTKRILGTITSYITSRKVWTTLERYFASQTKARALQLKIQLQTTKKGSSSITAYYSKMKLLVDNLVATGNFVTDDDLILYILSGLGQEYDLVEVNTTARTTTPSLEEVYSLLLTHKNRMEQHNSTRNEDLLNPNAHYANFHLKEG